MLRGLFSRFGCVAMVFCLVIFSCLTTSCSGGGVAAREMVLVEFLLVDRSLRPVSPTGTEDLARNAQILFVFSEIVNANTVTQQTIQIRYGPTFQSVPEGSFSVNGNQVRFDPTVTAQGQPNPYGFRPVERYSVDIPNFEEQDQVVENADFDPNLTTFFTSYRTSDGFLRELIPPEILDVFFIPDPDPLTKNIPGNGILAFLFTEPMQIGSFIQGPSDDSGPDVNTTIDVRYTPGDQINIDNLVANFAVPGTFSQNAAATIAFFRPTFSFGNKKLVFTAQVFQGLTDLSGNLLINPQSYGPFTCDGTGIETGKVITEDFLTQDPNVIDFIETDADWGVSEPGVLKSVPISSRNAYLFGYPYADGLAGGGGSLSGNGQYAAIVDPLTGADLNNFVTGINPPTSAGRRAMWSYSDTEIGAPGSVTAIGWGPDSNATFAAFHQQIIMRMGFQEGNSMTLGTSFSGNYAGGADAILYNGSYSIVQAANHGNTPGHPVTPHQGPYLDNFGCTSPNMTSIANWNLPLFSATGFYGWPELTQFFEWDAGDENVDNDSVLIFDVSVTEGDSFQQFRAWFGVTFPCSGVLITGFPGRRLYATFEEDQANPTTNLTAGILNPEPTIMDMCFTITKRVSVAQSTFYPAAVTFGPNTDYRPAELSPQVQVGGAQLVVEFQGAEIVDMDNITINAAGQSTGWTQDIDDLDGMDRVRWRVFLIANLEELTLARLVQLRIPMVSN